MENISTQNKLARAIAAMLLALSFVIPSGIALADDAGYGSDSLRPERGIFADSAREGSKLDEQVAETAFASSSSLSKSGAIFPFLPNPTTDEFIKSIAENARDIGQERGLYASVMIAQAILESGSGSSGLSKPPYNNLFGIKGSYHGKSVTMATSEDDGSGSLYGISAAFRKYPSKRASLEDYADLLTVQMPEFYKPVWKVNAETYGDACDYLQGHYATDTTYAGKLKSIISAYKLYTYDEPRGVEKTQDAPVAKTVLRQAVTKENPGVIRSPLDVKASNASTSSTRLVMLIGATAFVGVSVVGLVLLKRVL